MLRPTWLFDWKYLLKNRPSGRGSFISNFCVVVEIKLMEDTKSFFIQSHDRSNVWMNFHFDCLNPFLSCRDWVALSWCCKYFYQECNLKQTLPRKFRNDLLRVILQKEHPQWVDQVWKGLKEYNGILSGGAMVSVFCQCPEYGDVDIFYQSDAPDPFGLNTPSPLFQSVNSQIQADYYEIQHISAGNFIKDSINIQTSQTLVTWQFINTNKNFSLPETSRHICIMSPRDHVVGIIDSTFDLEFCKIAYHPNQLKICNLSSIIYQQSKMTFSHKLDDLTVSNWKSVPIIDPKVEHRAEKYIHRGFCITNYEDLLSVIRIQNVLECVEKYEYFMTRYNRKKDEEKKKEEEEKRKQAELDKKTRELVKKWIDFSNDDDDIQTTDRRRENHNIFFHRQYVPIVEWVTLYNISPNVVYRVLCYADQKDLIDLCFDKESIPRKWLDLEEYHARNYYYAIFTHRLSEPVFTRYFWKLIYAKWPSHFYCD